MNVSGKVAIVTGAGALVRDGHMPDAWLRRASVVVCDVDESGGQETVRLIEVEGGQRRFAALTWPSRGSARPHRLCGRELGGVDILVNNASPAYHPNEPLDWWFEPSRSTCSAQWPR